MEKNFEVTFGQVESWDKNEYQLVDIRDETLFLFGAIPGAVNITFSKDGVNPEIFSNDKKTVLYCSKGLASGDAVNQLREAGIEAYTLKGGYAKWLVDHIKIQADNVEYSNKDIEKSIRKKFHKQLFSRFTKAIKTYQLINEGDKVAVCISGGKDSMLMAKLFQELKKHHKFEFDLVFLIMDPGYSEENRTVIEKNAKLMNIPITIFNSNIFDSVYNIEKSPCYLCARMRRGYLYSKAKELGCNKIALGHHYDDVIETILMGMLYGAQIQTMMPKLHSSNFEGMELIRPMYLIREEDIKHWSDYNNLHFIQCACRFTDTCTTCKAEGNTGSKRMEIKELIQSLKETNPYIESNIFNSVENINLDTIIAYKKDGTEHHFLDNYDDVNDKGCFKE